MVAQIDRKFITARPWKIWSRLLAYTLFEGRPLTTRGQWINPVVLAGHRFWSALPLSPRRVHPIFILGTGRSGTTILGKILGLHPDVGYLNEPKALWHAALGNDDLIGSFSATQAQYRMDGMDALPKKVVRLQRSYRAFLGLSFSRRVVDKYPELIFRTGLLDAAFPDARKIVLVRNGYDTISSIAGWSHTHRDERADWWGRNRRKWTLLVDQLVRNDPFFANLLPGIDAIDDHLDMAAIEWIVTMREALCLRQSGEKGLIFVHYEDLLADPDKTLGRICDYGALAHDPKMLAYAKSVLRKPPEKPTPALHPLIKPLFDQTMVALGYGKTA